MTVQSCAMVGVLILVLLVHGLGLWLCLSGGPLWVAPAVTGVVLAGLLLAVWRGWVCGAATGRLRDEGRLLAFIRHAPSALGALDRDLRFVIASDRWSAEFDMPHFHNPTGMLLEDAFPSLKTRPDWQDALARCLGGEAVVMDEDCIRQDGRPDVWARWELRPWEIGPNGARGIIVTAENITRRKDMDRMKEEFISTVSHELRTPLTSIRGSLGLVTGGVAGDLPPKALELVDIAYKNSDRLILLINDILDMNRLESDHLDLRMQSYSVADLLRDAMVANAGYAQKFGVTLRLAAPEGGGAVLVDENRFQQVLSNLISNAIKFSPEGAPIDIGADIVDGHVRIHVRDYGPGIPRQFHARIFEKFSQADSSDTRAQGGTGLGLSIAKGLCERMGGWISFDTEEGAGTTFHIEFPVYCAADGDGRAMDDDGGDDPSKKSVLHVEDDPDFYRMIRSGLEPRVIVRNARTVRDANIMIDARDYDLIILDMRLPDGSGLSLLDQIKNKDKCPIVVISAYDVPDDVRPLAAACLIKAQTPESDMIETIMTLLGETAEK